MAIKKFTLACAVEKGLLPPRTIANYRYTKQLIMIQNDPQSLSAVYPILAHLQHNFFQLLWALKYLLCFNFPVIFPFQRSIFFQLFNRRQNFSFVQIQSICRQQFQCGSNFSLIGWQTLWEMQKMLDTIIFSFPTIFSKGFFP